MLPQLLQHIKAHSATIGTFEVLLGCIHFSSHPPHARECKCRFYLKFCVRGEIEEKADARAHKLALSFFMMIPITFDPFANLAFK